MIDNTFLEELDIGAGHEWILERVGIRARPTVLRPDGTTSYLGELARIPPLTREGEVEIAKPRSPTRSALQ